MKESRKDKWRAGSTTLPTCLRQATVSAAQRKRRLGQETARSMCRFQVRKWSKPHRGFAKNALAHPLHRGGYIEVTPSVSLHSTAPSEREPRDTMKLIDAEEIQARQGARGVLPFLDDKVHRLGKSRGFVGIRLSLQRLLINQRRCSLRDASSSHKSFAIAKSLREPCYLLLPSAAQTPSRAVVPALLLFPRICFASAREP